MPERFQMEAERLLHAGKIDELMGLCRADRSALAKILLAGLRNLKRTRNEIVEAMEIIGRQEAFALQKYLSVLGTIAAVGPLLGLLGTVSGMITTFQVISTHGTGNPALMAGGISEALVTTVTGLSVAIPSLLFHRYFLQRSRSLIVEMEVTAMGLLEELPVISLKEAYTTEDETPIKGAHGLRS